MASKQVLKHGDAYVPTINDSSASDFGGYETYSRKKIDEKLQSAGVTAGYDWSGRKIVFEGDSITMNATIGYPEYVAAQLGCEAIKIGISGKPIMGSYAGHAYDFRRRVSNIPADADAIVILGDCNAIDTDQGNEYSQDLTKWAGRWNEAIETIKMSFPTVPLFLVSEYPMSGKDNQNINVPVLFRALAQRYGAIFICLGEESPLSLLYSQNAWGLTETDGVHCSHEAMPLFADIITRHISQTPPPQWSGSDSISILNEFEVAVDDIDAIGATIIGDQSIQWTCDNMDIACVMGPRVHGMSAGTANITAKTRNGNAAVCAITISAS